MNKVSEAELAGSGWDCAGRKTRRRIRSPFFGTGFCNRVTKWLLDEGANEERLKAGSTLMLPGR